MPRSRQYQPKPSQQRNTQYQPWNTLQRNTTQQRQYPTQQYRASQQPVQQAASHYQHPQQNQTIQQASQYQSQQYARQPYPVQQSTAPLPPSQQSQQRQYTPKSPPQPKPQQVSTTSSQNTPKPQQPSTNQQHPVIVRAPQADGPLTKKLALWFKVRVFIIVYLDKPFVAEDLLQRIEKMGKSFQASYVLAIMRGGNDKAIESLQLSMGVQPMFIPVFDEQAAYDVILDILENDIKPTERNEKLEFTDEFLQERVLEALCTIPGLKRRDCMMLQEAIGCLSDLANATAEEIQERSPLSMEKAKIVETFFKNDE